MDRRRFSLQLAAAGVVFAGGAPAAPAAPPVEGDDYVRLSTPAKVSLPADKKVEVVEFFWYECPYCYAFEPMLERWTRQLPPDVAFRRVPVGFTARHQTAQRLFYALESLGQLDALHRRIFAAVQQKNRRLTTEADAVALARDNGLDPARFTQAYRSFEVDGQARSATLLAEAYKIDGVPALGIHGRFYTSPALAKSNERTLAVADALVDRVRRAA